MRRSTLLVLTAACLATLSALGLGASTVAQPPSVDVAPRVITPAEDEPAPLQASCGNNRCEPPEDCNSCPRDCGSCCGNNRCEPPEDCNSCPRDCGNC